MIIDSLPALSSPVSTDEIAIERGTVTYKATLSNLANGIGVLELHELVLTGQTVDANGNINTGLDAGANVVISARCSGYIVTPWVSGGTSTWWMHLVTFTGTAVSDGTNVGTVRVYYFVN